MRCDNCRGTGFVENDESGARCTECGGSGQKWRPFAHEVELKVGDTVYWDDRNGWEGRVTALPTETTLSVDYGNGESDTNIDRKMFTTTHRESA